jgi:hypothetical protein
LSRTGEESTEGSGTEGGLTNCTRICTMMNCVMDSEAKEKDSRCALKVKAMDTGFPVVKLAGGALSYGPDKGWR